MAELSVLLKRHYLSGIENVNTVFIFKNVLELLRG